MRTTERASVSNAQTVCTSCRSVTANGPTEVAEIMYMATSHIGIGAHFRSLQLSSSGLTPDAASSNAISHATFHDRFFLIGGAISIRFGTHP
jgi:hypothetical protein